MALRELSAHRHEICIRLGMILDEQRDAEVIVAHDVHGLEPAAIVLLCTYTANRDPEIWRNAEVFDRNRFVETGSPKMMAFGGGAHFCLGAWLARLTLEEVTRAVIAARPELAIPPDELGWEAAVGFNPATLPVRLPD